MFKYQILNEISHNFFKWRCDVENFEINSKIKYKISHFKFKRKLWKKFFSKIFITCSNPLVWHDNESNLRLPLHNFHHYHHKIFQVNQTEPSYLFIFQNPIFGLHINNSIIDVSLTSSSPHFSLSNFYNYDYLTIIAWPYRRKKFYLVNKERWRNFFTLSASRVRHLITSLA